MQTDHTLPGVVFVGRFSQAPYVVNRLTHTLLRSNRPFIPCGYRYVYLLPMYCTQPTDDYLGQSLCSQCRLGPKSPRYQYTSAGLPRKDEPTAHIVSPQSGKNRLASSVECQTDYRIVRVQALCYGCLYLSQVSLRPDPCWRTAKPFLMSVWVQLISQQTSHIFFWKNENPGFA